MKMIDERPRYFKKEYVSINTSFERAKRLMNPPKRFDLKKVLRGIDLFTYVVATVALLCLFATAALHQNTYNKGWEEGKATCEPWNDGISTSSSWNDIGKTIVLNYGVTILIVIGAAVVLHGFRVI